MTDLLRLDRLAVENTHEEDGSLIVTVRSKDPTFPKCCLLCQPRKLGTKAVRFRDFTVQAQPVWLEVRRQRFKCSECGKVLYEDLPDLDTEFRTTVRFRRHLAQQAVDHPFTTAATINGVHETLIRRIFAEHAERLLGNYTPRLPRVLGMDEIYLHRKARFVIGDVEKGLMIDMQPSRRETDLSPYFKAMVGRDQVDVVCQDMWSGYRKLTKNLFPKAVTVIDKYHVQRTANYGMEFVRKALYKDISNKDRIALKRKRALFLARWDAAKPETQASMRKVFDQHPALAAAYDLKERFYDIYESPDRAAAEHAMTKWLAELPTEYERPFKPSVDAIKNWRPHILRYFEHRFTSGYIERLNGLIRTMDRNGAGYSFDVLRNKALLKHGIFGETQIAQKQRPPRGQRGLVTSFMLDEAPPLVMVYPVRFGVELSTLQADLEAGTF